MVSAVSSASAALKVLQRQGPHEVASEQQTQDLLQNFLDPRSVLALAPQALDALLKVRAELRRAGLQTPEAAPSPISAPTLTTAKRTNLLGTFKLGYCISDADSWLQDMERLKTHLTEPLDSKLMPWNSADVLQQLRDRDVHSQNFDQRELELYMDDAAIYRSMAETPPEDAAEIRSRGGTVWYEYGHLNDRISDKEFYRNIKNYQLYGGTLRDPIDTSNEASQAFLSGTAQIIRGSNIPGFQYDEPTYISFAPNPELGYYTQVGGYSRRKTNIDQVFQEIEKKNPTMKVHCICAEGDVGFILYPKTIAPARPEATAAYNTLLKSFLDVLYDGRG